MSLFDFFVDVNRARDSNYEMKTVDFLVLSFQSSLGKRKIFSKKKNMEAVEVQSAFSLSIGSTDWNIFIS